MDWLPALNTALIVVSGAFLALGYWFIRHHHVVAHHRSMLTATTFAGLFLVVYIARWVLVGTKAFEGQGLAYVAYLAILVPHVILAIAVGPLALVVITLALRGRFPVHRRVARVALPIWAYVAASGWVVFTMLYLVDWDGTPTNEPVAAPMEDGPPMPPPGGPSGAQSSVAGVAAPDRPELRNAFLRDGDVFVLDARAADAADQD